MNAKHKVAIGMFATLSLILIVSALIGERLPGDLTVAQAIQDLPNGLGAVIESGEEIGSYWVMGPLGIGLIAVLLFRRRTAEATFMFVLGAWYLVSPLLKELIERPRPEPHELAVYISKSEFAFPSGHVFGATIVLGAIFLFADVCFAGSRSLALALRVSAAILFAIVALSRVYLGVHVPSDVLGGFVIAATGFVVFYALYRDRIAHFNKVRTSS